MGWLWFGKKKNCDAPQKNEEASLSPIQKMRKHGRDGDMVFKRSALEAIFNSHEDPDEMPDEEKDRIMDALFPRKLNMLKALTDAINKKEPIFPPTPSAVGVSLGTPTMDADVSPISPTGRVANLGKGLPGAIGAGMQPEGGRCPPPPGIGNKGQYPQLGKNAAIEANGLSLLPDPLNRFPINPRVLKHFQSRVWITYSGCAIIATHELVNRACAIPAEDAMAHGYKVVCASHEHEHTQEHDETEEQFLQEIKTAADKMGLNDTCIRLNYKKKVFGVAVAIPKVAFKEDYKSPDGEKPYSYADEYDVKAIKPKSFEGFAVIDPHWLTYKWDEESASDPTSPHFLVPTWIEVGSKKIHRSWCIRVVNSEIPDILKPAYYYGGLSLTQMIYERVWCADKLANEAPLLAMTKRLLIADGNLEQMISDARHTNIFFKAINYFRDNFSIFIKKSSSNVTQLDTSLSELTQLTMSQYQLVAAIAQIPVTKLLKNVPTGLQSTGDYEWDDYAQALRAIQDKDYTPLLRKFYEIYVASAYPDKTDIHLDVEWNPIDVPKEKELAAMSSQSAQYAAHLAQTHLVTIAEARSMLRKTGLPVFQAIPTTIPGILVKIEEANDPAKQQQPGGGIPKPGGAQPNQPQEQPPQEDPTVQRNTEVFRKILSKVKGEMNEESNPQEETQENTESQSESTGETDNGQLPE